MKLNEIFEAMLVFTFAFHYAFVLILTGVPILGLLQKLFAGNEDKGPWNFLKNQYPICISLTITTGIAPLLFAQTLFHGYFYQAFINLYPLPLIGLVLLTIFFYNSYLIGKFAKIAVPLTVLQILFLVSFVVFFSTLFRSIANPSQHSVDFWATRWPHPYWVMVGVHFGLGVTCSGLFFMLSGYRYLVRVVPLIAVGGCMAVFRERHRRELLDGDYPTSLQSALDPSFFLFVVSFIVIAVVVYKAFRIAGLMEHSPDATRELSAVESAD